MVLVYLLLFVSGSLLYNSANDKYLVIVFIVTMLTWFISSDRKINDRFILYACVFTGFLFIIYLYTDGGLSINSIIGTAMKLVLAYLILKMVGDRFVETYIK